ncbi:Transthyretin-like family protein [Cooperia oncophora]
MCGTAPLIGALVRLWSYKVVGPGHELANTTTDRNGHFYIQGKDSSLLPLNVRLKIKHHCETPTLCTRKLNLPLPPKYVVRGPNVEKWFDAGRLNVAYKVIQYEESVPAGNKTLARYE